MLAWMGVIALLSTDIGSEEHSTGYLSSLFGWLLPGVDRAPIESAVERLSWAIRKLAHLGEYLILAILAGRWLLRACGLSRPAWPRGAFAISAAYALLDEFHQIFVTSRSPAVWDVLLDWAGALIGIALYVRWARRVAP